MSIIETGDKRHFMRTPKVLGWYYTERYILIPYPTSDIKVKVYNNE